MARRVGFLWAMVLPACGTPPLETSSQAIQGGSTDDAHTYAIGLRINETSLCSATLIAPNLVLTARHCVAERSGSTECEKATFGKTIPPTGIVASTCTDLRSKDCMAWYDVKEIVTPSVTSACGQDVALLVLTKNVEGTTPATPQLTPLTNMSPFTAIGFGKTRATSGATGTRRVREDIELICAPGYSAPKYDCSKMGKFVSDKDFLSGAGVCPGDSGAGAFDQQSVRRKEPLAIGVASRGWGDEQDNCTFMIFNELAPHAELIRKTARQAASDGGYPIPLWVTNMGDGGTPPVTHPTGEAGTPAPSSAVSPPSPEKEAKTPAAEAAISCASTPGSGGSPWIIAILASGLILRRARRSR